MIEGKVAVVLSLVLAGCASSASPAKPGPSDASELGPVQLDAGTGKRDEAGARREAGVITKSLGPEPGRGDGSSSDSGACSPPSATAQVRQVLSGEVAAVDQQCGAADGGPPRLVGPVPTSTVLQFDIGLPVRNQSALNEYLQAISDPNSPQYRRYLTPAEYTAMFGPTACDYGALTAWAESQGLTVTMTYPDRLLLDLTATVSRVNAAFHVTINYYRRPDDTQFYAPDVDPSIDLSVPVLASDGLDNCDVPTPAAL